MTSLGLFFVGSVLFINGLSLLGRVDASGAAPVNAFVGSLLIVVTGFVVLPVTDLSLAENRDVVVGSVGFLLFAFTYLWVALNNWTGHSGSGLGWYCLWACGVSVFLALVNLLRFDDVKFASLWVMWAVLFAAFFAVLGLGRTELARPTGWLTVVEAFTTTTIPGALLLLGEWEGLAGGWAVAGAIVTIGTFAALAMQRGAQPSAATVDGDLSVASAAR